MTERAKMAKFDAGHRLPLPGGCWLQKRDDEAEFRFEKYGAQQGKSTT